MPRKSSVPAPLKALLEQAAAARKEQRAAEAPVLAARRPLSENLTRLKANVARAHASKQKMMRHTFGTYDERTAAWIHSAAWRDCMARMERYTAELLAAETTLATFDALHIETSI
jgi:hypothetical protein